MFKSNSKRCLHGVVFLKPFILCGILLCSFLAGCLLDNKNGNDSAIVEIAGRTFRIPYSYIDGDQDKIIKDAVVLEYVLPEFEPQPPHPQKRMKRKELILSGRMRGMLLETAESRPALDTAFRSQQKSRHYKKDGSLVFGLEKYIAPSPSGESSEQPDDLFLEKNKDGIVQSYIHCSPPGKDKVPGCRHRFIDKNILYNIRWNLSELPNWRSQRDAAIRFINAMEISFKERN